ncbi:lysine exporter LysO family protein [Mangrovibacterium marinum]|uniref:Lysine exporter LysO-like protein n=1 Tax=Mangrovibacterium marinum TaxID=1639118 RepID=A0A2T5BY10_9BACT|nr:lysine exporter LysO family protein [Mangrovibacterium marinum]PTN06281.1 lysine exporter LysO-like protein [Mangrovibacterium marinum]
MKGSLLILAFFTLGCFAGYNHWLPSEWSGSTVSTIVLYILMFCVGIALGHDKTLLDKLKGIDRRQVFLPFMTMAGTLAGCLVASAFINNTASESMAVGSGFAYYSLSSIFIADFKGPELGTIALLCNIMRELFALLFIPILVRWFGPLSAISTGGATTFDTTLPVISQSMEKEYVIVAVFHGIILDFSVPFLVTFFCSI